MDKISNYMQVVPLPVLILAPFIAMFGFLAVPSRYRLDVALAFMAVWLEFNRMPGLGPVFSFAKTTTFAVFLAVIVAAMLDRKPKQRVAPLVWLYPVVATYAFAFVLTTTDRSLGLVLRLQWLLLVLAAIATVRTIVDFESLRRVVRALAVGMVIAMCVTFSALIIEPGRGFGSGLNRFEPWGSNSNMIGILFAMAFPIMALGALESPTLTMRPWYLVAAFGALGQALLTQSRLTLAVLVVSSLPLVTAAKRKPMLSIAAVVLGIPVLGYVISQAGQHATFERFGSLESERFEIWSRYLQEQILPRPVFGLLGTEGRSFARAYADRMHVHNAYLDTAYLGGLALLGPMLVLAGASMLAAVRVFRRRKRIGAPALLIMVFCATMFAVYMQGFGDPMMYYPNYGWAFYHVFLSVLLITWSWQLKRGIEPLAAIAWDEGAGWQPWDAPAQGGEGEDGGYAVAPSWPASAPRADM